MMRRPDEVLEQALRDMREQQRQGCLPDGVETRLRSAVRTSRNASRLKWAIPAAVAAALFLVLFLRKHPDTRPVEITSYIELPASAGLPAPSASTIMRLQISREELRQYGLDVRSAENPSELLLADFVVGDDGLARAVHFVE